MLNWFIFVYVHNLLLPLTELLYGNRENIDRGIREL